MGVSTGDLRSVTWAWSENIGFFPPEGLTNNVSICNYITRLERVFNKNNGHI